MENKEDTDREDRKYAAIRFSLRAALVLIIVTIIVTLGVLTVNDWDTHALGSNAMLIFYVLVFCFLSGAFAVATKGWQEKD